MAITLEKFYALQIPEVRDMFISAMQDIADNAMIEEMIKAIETNDVDRLVQASGFNAVYLNKIIDKIEDVYEKSGSMLTDGWPRLRNGLGLAKAVFNMRNESVEKDLVEYSSRFITQVSDEIKESIRLTLVDGMSRGLNPRETALNIVGRKNLSTGKRIGGTIGLSANQTQWVNNARKYLQNLDKRYFNLTLRDKRFDSIVKKAIQEGKPLTKEKISQLITAYESKALKYRADAIARTETMQAINRAEYMGIKQNIEEGFLTADMVTKWWSTAGDERVRLSHMELGSKYNKENAIPFDEPFETFTGSKLMFPGDTSLGANLREIIHCRCMCKYDINFLKEYENG